MTPEQRGTQGDPNPLQPLKIEIIPGVLFPAFTPDQISAGFSRLAGLPWDFSEANSRLANNRADKVANTLYHSGEITLAETDCRLPNGQEVTIRASYMLFGALTDITDELVPYGLAQTAWVMEEKDGKRILKAAPLMFDVYPRTKRLATNNPTYITSTVHLPGIEHPIHGVIIQKPNGDIARVGFSEGNESGKLLIIQSDEDKWIGIALMLETPQE